MIAWLARIPLKTWLIVGLIVSVSANVYQVYRAGVAAAQAAHAVDKAAAAAREKAQESVNAAATALAEIRAERHEELVGQLRDLNAETASAVGRYRSWVRGLPPLPSGCGPGSARVDAFNRRE